ncbi:membrane protein [Lactococcus hodotermopsidis]|uniref:Membrane protein n=1 Tax=Pseudolactococcus hodotermopsidis TaxID=2709157 RepID=A0A6A0BBH4_9LACT|nr:DUF624 domain-containing protein [Lactococcus hodotermopsidis]GFH42692.1 membrane protein [Lactococcus hodotermopsidis]
MLGTALDKGFSLVWSIMKVNFYFILFTLMGGIVLGIGPAFQTATDLLVEFESNWKALTFRRAFDYWRTNFKVGNRNFWLYAAVAFAFGYNLYLAIQIKKLVFFAIGFVLIFCLVLASVIYLYVTLYTSEYEVRFRGILKLALTSTFLNFASFFKLLFGIFGIFVVSWNMKGLFIFGTFAMLAYWSVISTKPIRNLVAHKLTGEKLMN